VSGAWTDAVSDGYPDWLRINFDGGWALDDVSTTGNNDFNAVEGPFISTFGITSLNVRYGSG